MDNYKVYMHISPSNKRYIGITKSVKPENRWGSRGQGYRNQVLFNRAIQKYGWDNFEHIIVADHLTKQDACNIEKELIIKYKTKDAQYGYNLTNGGEGTAGYIYTEEQRKERSARLKGHIVSIETRKKIGEANKIALKGKHLSEETKRKLSIANKGKSKPHSAEWCKQHSEKLKGNKIHLGYKASEESRKRMSEAHKGLPLTQKQLDNLHRLHELHRGKPRSEETKQKIRESHLGKSNGPWSEATRKAHMDANERRRRERENPTTL